MAISQGGEGLSMTAEIDVMDVTVKVPKGHLGEFYALLGTVWHRAESEAEDDEADDPEADLQDWVDNDFDLEPAGLVWRKFSSNAKAMFSLLMENPGDGLTGAELAERLGIENGQYGVAGILAWPGRHCAAVNRVLLCRFEEAPAPGAKGVYWIDEEVASLFGKVRAGAEQAAATGTSPQRAGQSGH
jgi:hypothetical protein